jgi:hypothetical protein
MERLLMADLTLHILREIQADNAHDPRRAGKSAAGTSYFPAQNSRFS